MRCIVYNRNWILFKYKFINRNLVCKIWEFYFWALYNLCWFTVWKQFLIWERAFISQVHSILWNDSSEHFNAHYSTRLSILNSILIVRILKKKLVRFLLKNWFCTLDHIWLLFYLYFFFIVGLVSFI